MTKKMKSPMVTLSLSNNPNIKKAFVVEEDDNDI